MARFGGNKKFHRGNKKSLYTLIKGRQNAKRKPLLSGKGVTQALYEAGFFDFFKVFWNHNLGMELRSLTKQVANTWEALVPKPKLSKKRVLKEYSKEFKQLQQEIERRDAIEESRTETDSRSNLEDSEESIRSNDTNADDRSGSDKDERSQTDDESISENTSRSHGYSESEFESDESTDRSVRRAKRKRSGRRYESYEAYLKAHGKKIKSNTDKERNEVNEKANNSKEDKDLSSDQYKQDSSDTNPKDNTLLPIRELTSFDRIVRAELDDQNEMLRKLKVHRGNIEPNVPDNDYTRTEQSVDSFASPLSGPNFPSQGSTNSITAKLSNPTDTLHVKNLVVGIRQPELQEIFRVFSNDIVLIRVLDNKYNGEAVVEFKSVEAAEKVWRQMNGVEYKRLPLVLEFTNKEDLIH